MGPPPFGGGNVLPNQITRHMQDILQWGHRLSVVETSLTSVSTSTSTYLQWSHHLSVVETSTTSPGP